ncbi:hypothetical protein BSG1_17145 [Bacillus sp. SG-1]|nr:hypothetical protein BSG1_17145 [Bacillus sp. SG-1]
MLNPQTKQNFIDYAGEEIQGEAKLQRLYTSKVSLVHNFHFRRINPQIRCITFISDAKLPQFDAKLKIEAAAISSNQ